MTDPIAPDQPTLRTDRLVLRPRTADDAEALFPAMSDAAVMQWWSRPPFGSVQELRDYFAANGTWRAWAIVEAGMDHAIGFVAAGEKRQRGVTELGFLLAPAAQGRGIAGEAVGRLITHLFAKEGQRRVFADTDPENQGSVALLRRLGFQLEGRLRAEWKTHAGIRDSLIFGLLAAEWPTVPA